MVTPQLRRAVFLDRDGVINRSIVRNGKPYAPSSLDEFEILPQVGDALQRLRESGFLNVVVTNQPDLATGRLEMAALEAMHALMRRELALDAILFCAHVDADECTCRKPKPGLLVEAARELSIDLQQSYMIGDRWRDIGAGQSAGCTCIFIDYGYDDRRPQLPYWTAGSLAEATERLLSTAQHPV